MGIPSYFSHFVRQHRKIIKPIKFYYTKSWDMEDEIKSKITSISISIINWNHLSDTFKKSIEDDLMLIP